MQVGIGPVVMLIIGLKARETVGQFDIETAVDGIAGGYLLFAHRPYL